MQHSTSLSFFTGVLTMNNSSRKSFRCSRINRCCVAASRLLAYEPARATRRRKCLAALSPSFEHVPPVWQLRVGDFRVFYDVDEAGSTVHVRAVRRKDPDQRTEDIT